ncbi:MAG: hypothetical protein V3V03_08650 [Hyphomonadaceae bacterium]
MTVIAYFGHNAANASIRRRVQAFSDDGIEVTGFMMRRSSDVYSEWRNVDLGLTRDGALLQRVKTIFSGARKAAEERDLLAKADVIFARNLDMLACAFLAKRHTKLKTPVVYECQDVHRLLSRPDLIGMVVRSLERFLVKRCALVTVSSPGFEKNHFARRYKGHYTAYLLENRLSTGSDYGPRPEPDELKTGQVLKLGWFGNLRCKRSYDLLLNIADKFGDQIEIFADGQPSDAEISDFEAGIDQRPNVHFGGRYKAPEDLARIYGQVDLVWAGDFMEAGYNSIWLLPNRLYEGGYYVTPPIAPAGTQTAAWSEAHNSGFSLVEPLEETLPELIGYLLADPAPIAKKQAVLSALDASVFVQPIGEMKKMIDAALGRGRDG